MKDHRLIDERSLAFDRLTAAKILENPAVVDMARKNIERWLVTSSPGVLPVMLEWQRVLDGPLDELLALLAATDEKAVQMRQSSPFTGVLSNAERTSILLEFQARETAGA